MPSGVWKMFRSGNLNSACTLSYKSQTLFTYSDGVIEALNNNNALNSGWIDVLETQVYLNLLSFSVAVLIFVLDSNWANPVLVWVDEEIEVRSSAKRMCCLFRVENDQKFVQVAYSWLLVVECLSDPKVWKLESTGHLLCVLTIKIRGRTIMQRMKNPVAVLNFKNLS